MFFSIVLIMAIIGLMITVFVQQGRVTIARRMRYNQGRQMSKEREATAAILGLSGDAINTDISDESFLSGFIAYADRAIQGSGAAVMTVNNDNVLKGCAIAGTFPPLREVPIQVEQQLIAHPKKHIEFFKELNIQFTVKQIDELCGKDNYVFFYKKFPEWIPKGFTKSAPRMLISPIRLKAKTVAVVMVVSMDDFDMHKITEEEGKYLVRLNEIATLSLKGIRAFRERREHEEQIQTAREEGMLQVSAGIIHNIGNAVTVAKLTVHDLTDKMPEGAEHPEYFILNEMLPRMEKEIQAGTLQKFITEDDAGKQYIDIIKELLQHINNNKIESSGLLTSLNEKLMHISEIIELQQRFVGELGTENMTALSSVIESSVKIFEETCNRHGVELDTQLSDDVPQVLIDSSMMTQVFMNLIKNAVEAMDSQEKKKNNKLTIKLYNGTDDDSGYAVTEIIDNGPGMPDEVKNNIFNFGFSTKEDDGSSTRGYGLHSCLDTIKKYGGTLKVDSQIDRGTTFKIMIPAEKGMV
jgi:signal transduction histidine kinase